MQAPNIMKGHWDYVARGQGLLGRLRRQTLPMLLVIAVTALAAFNAVALPTYLDRQIGAPLPMLLLQPPSRCSYWLENA